MVESYSPPFQSNFKVEGSQYIAGGEEVTLPAQCAYSANVVTLGHNFFWIPQSALFFLKCIIMVVERGAHFFLKIWSLFRWWEPSKPPKIGQNSLKIRKFQISTSGGLTLAIGPCSGLEHVRAHLG